MTVPSMIVRGRTRQALAGSAHGLDAGIISSFLAEQTGVPEADAHELDLGQVAAVLALSMVVVGLDGSLEQVSAAAGLPGPGDGEWVFLLRTGPGYMAALPLRPDDYRLRLATPLPALAQTPAAQAPPARTPPAETTGVTAEQAPQVPATEGDALSLPGRAGHVPPIVSPAHGTRLSDASEIA